MLYEHHKSELTPAKSKSKHPKLAPDGALYIESLEPNRELSQTDSCLEFLLISFCQSFEISPKQAAGLLTQGNKFLAHVIVKGLKGDHNKVHLWYSLLKNHSEKLNSLILSEIGKGSLNLVLSALKPGFLSKNVETAKKCCEVLEIIFGNLNSHYGMVLDWITKEGLDAMSLCLKRLGDSVGKSAAKVFMRLKNADLLEIVSVKIKNHFEPSYEYLKALQALYLGFAENKDQFSKSELLHYYLNYCLSTIESQKISDPKDKVAFSVKKISTLCMIWVDFADSLDEYSNEILSEIKRTMKDTSVYTKFVVVGHFFYLLERFYTIKKPVVGLLLKLLIFTLIENYEIESLREFILANFIQIVESIESIPIFSILDPLLKQAEYTQTVRFNVFDYDFLLSASQHPRITLDNQIYMMDILSKVYLEDLLFSKAAVVPIVFIIGTFYDKLPIQQFVMKLCELTLNIVATIETSKFQKIEKHDKKSKFVQQTKSVSSRDVFISVDQAHRRFLIYELIVKFIKLRNDDLNTRLIKFMVESNSKIKEVSGFNCKGLEYLLGLLGNPEDLIKEHENNKVVLYQSAQNFEHQTPLYKPPAITGRAAEDIERIKNSRILNIQKKLKIEEEMKKKQDKLMEIASKNYMKNKVERIGIIENTQESLKLEAIEYYDLNYESKFEVDILDKLIKRYALPLKLLFNRYNRPIINNFQPELSKYDENLITEPQVLNLLKLEGVIPDLIRRDDAISIIKEVFKRESGSKTEVVQFTKKIFHSLLFQLAANIFKRNSFYQITPLAYSLFTLLMHFRTNEKVVKIFDDFDPGSADRDAINFINYQLEIGNEVELPQNIYKTVDHQFSVIYRVPKILKVKKSYKIAVEIIDSILEKTLGMHFLRPQLLVTAKSVARGNLSVNSVVLPVYLTVSPVLKYNILKLAPKNPLESLIECSKSLEEVLSSVSNGKSFSSNSSFLSSKNQKNSFLRQKELEALEEMQKKQKSEANRIQRRLELDEFLKSKKLEQENKEKQEQKLLEEQKQQENKRLMEAEERKKKEKNDKKKQIEEWKEKKQQEEQEKNAKKHKEKAKSISQTFLPKIRKNLSELALKFDKKPKENLKEIKPIKASDNSKGLAKILIESKKIIEVEQKKKEDFSKYLELKEVREAFSEYNKVIDIIFKHYLELSLKGSSDTERGLDFKRINKLCIEFFIQPSLISSSELTILFNKVTRDKPKYILLEEFKVILAEIAFLSSESLQKALPDEEIKNSFRLLMKYMRISPEMKNSLQVIQALKRNN